ncbi:MAG: S9 family peptidase [Colwellia sp.]|nr:S9 family peptidase [Colwellia sp.]
MPLLLSVVLGSGLVSCSGQVAQTETKQAVKSKYKLTYPVTKQGETVDNYFGRDIADPYRWLEDDRSEETAAWVKAQNKTTFDYLDKIPYRAALKKRLTALWNYEKMTSPFKEGDYTYFYKNDGLQDQYVVYRYKTIDNNPENAEVFLDPNTFSKDATTSLGQLSFSRDGSIAAYAISEGGSDWRKIIIIDTATNKVMEPKLVDVKFSGIAWYKNEGFYYSSYDKPKGSELSAKTDQHKLYYHKLGTAQTEDKVIFGATPEQKRRYVGGVVTSDDRYLLISGAISTSGNDLYLKDLTKPDSELVTILAHTESDTRLITSENDQLILVTNLNADNKKVVTVDVAKPTPAHWVDLIPETNHVLNVSSGGGYLFTRYMVDAISNVYQYDYQGNKVREIELPGAGTASSISGKKADKTLYFTFTNYVTPRTILALNTKAGTTNVFYQSKVKFNSDDFVSKQVFYTSKDGTKVPMIINHKKGLILDGNNPTILYGYGGFNVSLTPSFGLTRTVWMEQGGIYAVANLRGGGEYGRKWHNAGTKMQKQNVFDDFIAAAQYLTQEKYTSSDFLAIQGGSNGGLLVAAVMLQRPELFKVALPAVGVLDMLRYHTFTSGAGWAYDYGTAEQNKEMFDYLSAYSPVHNVKAGVRYPATLVTTGDHDDRVVPAHSFKFAAELQAKQNQANSNLPMLIRIETNSGHGAGTPASKTINQYADIFGFTLYNMGIKELSN